MQMKYDKERRDEVYSILADMNAGVISKEEGEQQLRTYSPQLVEMVRNSQNRNWKASSNVLDKTAGSPYQDLTKKAVMGRVLIIVLGCYAVFAGAVISLLEVRLSLENQNLDFLKIGIGVLGIVLGYLTIRLFKIGTLLCAGWAAAIWQLSPVWIVPSPVFGIMLFGFVVQLILQRGKQKPVPALGLTGIFLSMSLLTVAFLSELFYKTTDAVKIETPVEITEKIPDQLPVNYLFAGAGVLVLILGIIFLVRGLPKEERIVNSALKVEKK